MVKLKHLDRSHEGFEGKRIDELPTGWWRPLTLPELLALGPVKLNAGRFLLRTTLIGKMYWERERLIFATESARWVMQCLDELGIFSDETPQGLEPPEVLKALAVLRTSLNHVEGIEAEEG